MDPVVDALCLRSRSAKRLKVVNTGLKLFEYNSRKCECAYRICQEGLPMLRPFMTQRVVRVGRADFLRILETQKNAAELAAFSESTQKQMEAMEVGACVFELDEEARKELTAKFPAFERTFASMGCVVWRGTK